MWKKLLAMGLVAGALGLPVDARAGEIRVQTTADAFEAQSDEAGTNTSALARITVVMTNKGKVVNEQGNTTGNGTAEIALPAGWSLIVYNVPTGGCEFVPVRFINQGDGVYTLEVLPPPDTPACEWQSGEYTYVVRFAKGSSRGSGLGRLTIP